MSIFSECKENLFELIVSRRSTRKYSDKKVEEEKLIRIIEAGRYAPSGGNSQNCHFTVITNGEVIKKLEEMVKDEFAKMEFNENTYSSLINSINLSKKGKYIYDYSAPVLVIISNLKNYANALADSACAIENMMLMCNAEDLGSCYINQLHWLDENQAIRAYLKELGIPDNETVCASLAIGYADTADGLPVRKQSPRKGNPISWVR